MPVLRTLHQVTGFKTQGHVLSGRRVMSQRISVVRYFYRPSGVLAYSLVCLSINLRVWGSIPGLAGPRKLIGPGILV